MTEAMFVSFVKSALRSASRRWKPIYDTLKEARRARGIYECAGCGNLVPPTQNRKKNISVDHRIPIIDPVVGFVDWNDFIARLYCEREGLQLLCRTCHDAKSRKERRIATERRKNGKTDI
jgi:5-methylcytosine-specific restriction endonuclease McrA